MDPAGSRGATAGPCRKDGLRHAHPHGCQPACVHWHRPRHVLLPCGGVAGRRRPRHPERAGQARDAFGHRLHRELRPHWGGGPGASRGEPGEHHLCAPAPHRLQVREPLGPVVHEDLAVKASSRRKRQTHDPGTRAWTGPPHAAGGDGDSASGAPSEDGGEVSRSHGRRGSDHGPRTVWAASTQGAHAGLPGRAPEGAGAPEVPHGGRNRLQPHQPRAEQAEPSGVRHGVELLRLFVAQRRGRCDRRASSRHGLRGPGWRSSAFLRARPQREVLHRRGRAARAPATAEGCLRARQAPPFAVQPRVHRGPECGQGYRLCGEHIPRAL
mmetsp:Transcript_13773/g.31211  ORF Transcript_13773/g.31211 Transcript_13773/m.31211 type:complete len:326 (+) Transcript_13773:49-1026(+)